MTAVDTNQNSTPNENMLARRTCALVFALVLLGALTAHAQTTPTAHGVAVAMADGSTIELAVAGLWSFRVTAIFDHSAAGAALASPIVPASYSAYADFKTTSGPASFVGIATAFGEARIDPTSGAFVLLDAEQNVLTQTPQLASLQTSSSAFSFENSTTAVGTLASNATCASVFPSTDARGGRRTSAHPNGLPGSTQQSCCTSCDADPECSFWVCARLFDRFWVVISNKHSRAILLTFGCF